MEIIKKSFIVFSVLLTSACVSVNNQSISKEDHDQVVQSNTLIVNKVHTKPSFSAMTAGKATFAMMGAVAMIAQGNSIIKENNIDDPALYINESILNRLQNKYSIGKSEEVVFSDETNISKLATQFPTTDYLLDTRTVNWSYMYFPTDWAHYRVVYTVKSRLIDLKNKKILSEAFCSRIPDSKENAPTQSALLDNQASLLKEILKKHANECADELYLTMFQLVDSNNKELITSND